MFRVLICGSRSLLDSDYIFLQLDSLLLNKKDNIDCVISGCAKGPDSIAIDWCEKNNVKVLKFYPDWKLYGNRAGYIRNETMLIEGNPTHVIAFQDIRKLKKGSNGTNHMIKLSTNKNIPVKIFYYS